MEVAVNARAAKPDPVAIRAVMRARFRNPIFWGLALWYTSYSLTASSLIFQLVPVLTAQGVPSHDIYLCFALIGPVQVLARILALTLGRHATTAVLGGITGSASLILSGRNLTTTALPGDAVVLTVGGNNNSSGTVIDCTAQMVELLVEQWSMPSSVWLPGWVCRWLRWRWHGCCATLW